MKPQTFTHKLKSALRGWVILGAAAFPASAQAPAQTPSEWRQIAATPVTINGRMVTPSCSQAPGTTNPNYAFWFQQGTADGLVVFFQGGGACWSDGTCSKPRLAGDHALFKGNEASSLYEAELLPDVDPTGMTGLLDRSNPLNPVRDWSKIFLPYCTGDVHSGSNTANYRNPENGQAFTIQHRGADNAQVVAHWMRANVPAPARLLVSGSSAGAYGSAGSYAALRELYPNARAVYLGDAGMGVTTPEFESARDASWNYQLPASVFGPNAQRTPDAELIGRLAAFFPRDRFAQYTAIYDATQRAFLGQMGGAKTCDTWTTRMLGELARRQASPNFRSYVAEGEIHTILRSPLFFTQQSGGESFAQWVGKLISDQAPENRICTNCQMAPGQCP